MLHIWMEQNVLFYGMIGAGILGILCMFMVDRFYSRAIRDVRRITEPKGKWTKEFLNQYQMRLTKEQEINNPEAFVRTQKHWESGYKSGSRESATARFCASF